MSLIVGRDYLLWCGRVGAGVELLGAIRKQYSNDYSDRVQHLDLGDVASERLIGVTRYASIDVRRSDAEYVAWVPQQARREEIGRGIDS